MRSCNLIGSLIVKELVLWCILLVDWIPQHLANLHHNWRPTRQKFRWLIFVLTRPDPLIRIALIGDSTSLHCLIWLISIWYWCNTRQLRMIYGLRSHHFCTQCIESLWSKINIKDTKFWFGMIPVKCEDSYSPTFFDQYLSGIPQN